MWKVVNYSNKIHFSKVIKLLDENMKLRFVFLLPHDGILKTFLKPYEPRHEKKTVFGVCDQLRLKPACSADETS